MANIIGNKAWVKKRKIGVSFSSNDLLTLVFSYLAWNHMFPDQRCEPLNEWKVEQSGTCKLENRRQPSFVCWKSYRLAAWQDDAKIESSFLKLEADIVPVLPRPRANERMPLRCGWFCKSSAGLRNLWQENPQKLKNTWKNVNIGRSTVTPSLTENIFGRFFKLPLFRNLVNIWCFY